jgi:spermidine/putrescine transport system substrate-binding protein
MKKLFIILALLMWIVLPVAAQEVTPEPEVTWVCPETVKGGQLNILNWSGYIGETTIADFERLCEVTTTFDIFDSNESLMARMRQGNAGYDVAFPNEFAVSIMARESLIQTIDITQIPNFANAAEQWVGLSFDPNNEYSVPYLWGTFGILYDRDKTGRDILHWDDFFTYQGSVAWVDDTHSLLGTALQQLGYDPNTTNEAEVMEARDYLIANSSNVQTITSDPGPLFAGGEFDMITTYSGDAYQIITDCGCDNFVYVVPEEGSVGDITNIVLLTGAPNPEVAIAFMDYIMDPVVNAMIVNDVIYATANQAAVDSGLINPEILTNTAIWPDAEALESLWFTEDLGDAEFYYSDAWDEVLVGVGG